MPAVSWYVLGILIEQLNLTFLCSESIMCPIVWLNATGGRSFDAAEVTWGAAVCAGSDLPVWDGDSWYSLEWLAGRFPGEGPGKSWSGLVSSAFSAVTAKWNIRILAFKIMKKNFNFLGHNKRSRVSSAAAEKTNKKLSVKAHSCHTIICEAEAGGLRAQGLPGLPQWNSVLKESRASIQLSDRSPAYHAQVAPSPFNP